MQFLSKWKLTSKLVFLYCCSQVCFDSLEMCCRFLLSPTTRRSVVDLMPMIGARYYTYLDTTQLQNDILEHELSKEMENGRLCRLLVKLATINERPEYVSLLIFVEYSNFKMIKIYN